jgi:hypothetical protein
MPLAVIDGPYDATALTGILARAPVSLGISSCGIDPSSACAHGTFIIGLLGARRDALIPGVCPDCQLLHIPLFVDERAPQASVEELANAIALAVGAGARLINLSLAILANDLEYNRELAKSLDYAEASGTVVVVAAGNQGRLAMGPLLSHPVTIPVVAVDAAGRSLPDCNFGPLISRRGVAAPGHNVLGYAPGGGTAVMSGTSVATAVATGILAQAWSDRPNADANEIRMAVAQLWPRDGRVPPALDREIMLMALDRKRTIATAASFSAGRKQRGYASLQGEATMSLGNELPRFSERNVDPFAMSGQTAAPAGGVAAGCSCGASGPCTCNGAENSEAGFVYAIGTVEAEYPNVAIEREMQVLGHHFGVAMHPDPTLPMKPTEDRSWQYAVLNADRKMTRYVARQLTWRLTVEDFPAFILKPQDPSDLDGLIDCLDRSKYPRPHGGSKEQGTNDGKKARGKQAGGARNETEGSTSIDPPHGPPQDLDVVVGVRGTSTADGIEVLLDHVFTIPADRLSPGGLGIFAQLSDNYGLTDADRAYNFLAARYTIPPQYLAEIESLGLVSVPVISSRLSGATDRIVRVIFTLKGVNRPIEKKYFVRVDVTHKFPAIVNSWQPYLERGEAS